ncbi:MAG: DUF4368 domain-containing protein, partial [Treponema sp.]|nr:DUF4368 domain-containing protein [Treponema sp.]
FERVQELLGEPKKKPKSTERPLYYGYLFCEACKRPMRINRRISRKISSTYFCYLASKKQGACTFHCINEGVLSSVVLEQINRLIVFAKTNRKVFDEMLRSKSAGIFLAELKSVTDELDSVRTRISEIDRFVQGLFESKIKGEIDSDMFCTFSESYRGEKTELNERLEFLIDKEETLKKKSNKSVTLGTTIHNYDTISEVTPEVLRDFIDRIEVGDVTGNLAGGKKSRKISVFFIGIGEVFPD